MDSWYDQRHFFIFWSFFIFSPLTYDFRFSGDEKHRNKNVWPCMALHVINIMKLTKALSVLASEGVIWFLALKHKHTVTLAARCGIHQFPVSRRPALV